MLQLSIVKFTIFSYYRVITVQSPLDLIVTQRAVIVIASVLTLCCYTRVCKKFRITMNNNAIKSINVDDRKKKTLNNTPETPRAMVEP